MQNPNKLVVFLLAAALPLAAHAVDYQGNAWQAGGARSFSQQLEAPAGRYSLVITAEGGAPIAVHNRFLNKNAAPILRLNNGETSASAEVELRATKPGHAFGYIPLEIRVGDGKKIDGGRYDFRLTPLF